MQKLLIIGCIRSGTTLLASMIGGHSQINMLDECYTKEIDNLIGKKYQGNKVVIPHIKYKKRGSYFRYALYLRVKRFITILKWFRIKIFFCKGSLYSIKDYIDMGAKIVFIYRGYDDNLDSIVRRQNLYKWHGKLILRKALKLRDKLPAHLVSLSYLTCYPEDALTKICNYLDIPFEEGMLESCGVNKNYKNNTIEKKK